MMSKSNTIIVLHKSGEPSHYRALQHLATKNEIIIKYREFSVSSKMLKSILKIDFKTFVKQWVNLATLISLRFSKNQVVVLGIAPYDKKLGNVLRLLQGHHISYHTSWPIWDQSDYPKRKEVTDKVLGTWRFFLEETVEHIYAVTDTAKQSLLSNYKITAPISVVAHSYDPNVFFNDEKPRKFKACYAGRYVPEKGIEELIEWSARHDNYPIAFMGHGSLKEQVDKAATMSHFQSLPRSNDARAIRELFQQSEYLLLYGKRTKKWQELFGMVIIEAMACGCIPIATDHVGPHEIIDHGVNGYLVRESDFLNQLSAIIDASPTAQLQKAAVLRASDFTIHQISSQWKPILSYFHD